MKFLPINRQVEVKPIEQKGIMVLKDATYEAKGEVISVAEGVLLVKPGQICFFDEWLVAHYTDSEGNLRYLVPEENIRAIEHE